ncbi:MAG: hypothetical protein JWQ13_956 [Ramlibacter sp.]|jgi:hypothetical protein|nr:hypothetical protein [Ramlibacter sp.]
MSTPCMVLHRPAPGNTHTLRFVGYAAAYSLAMATGTALLIAGFAAQSNGNAAGSQPTVAEVVMQQAAERAMQPQEAQLMAARNTLNDKRGL